MVQVNSNNVIVRQRGELGDVSRYLSTTRGGGVGILVE